MKTQKEIEKEFNLSEKIKEWLWRWGLYDSDAHKELIKINEEFIRLLKDKAVTPYKAVELMEEQPKKDFKLMCFIDVDEIDKLAGEKLKC